MTHHTDSSMTEFEDLAMPMFDSLYNFACWLAADKTNAEDLVQETYLKALRGFVSFQAGTNFHAWMFRILKNCFLSSRSTLAARMSVPMKTEADSPHLPVNHETPEAIFMARIGVEAILDAIARLPVIFREVILLRDVEGYSYREISEIVDIPTGTVMSRLARARQMVRGSVDGPDMTSASVGAGYLEERTYCSGACSTTLL